LLGKEEELEKNRSDYAQNTAMDRADRRYLRHERENRLLIKTSEDRRVFDDVFDMRTLMVLNSMISDGVFKYLRSPFASGKESKLYLALDNNDKFLAIKIYLTVSAEFKKRLQYIAGDPRFSNIKQGSQNLIATWAKKEFRNLKTAYEAGVNVPSPYQVRRNVLAMEFMGDSEGNPYLNLVDADPITSEDYDDVIEETAKLYNKANLVHADLSQYNIFKDVDHARIILFDFGSSIDIKHPKSKEFLTRDIVNINNFFAKHGVKILPNELAIKRVMGEKNN
jgi:RIO kinase 1